jgi:hypothetical protein
MPDHLTVTTNQSWGSRMGDAIKGVLIGVALFLFSFVALWWNEGRAVQTAKSLEEGQGKVVHVKEDKVDKSHEGDLVHVTAEAVTDETLKDDTFAVSSKAIKLVRTAEMFQWKEESHSETRKKLGGGTETVTTYDYKKDWSSTLVDSGAFKDSAEHVNPSSMPVESGKVVAKKVTLGAFTLSPELIDRMDDSEPLKVDKLEAESLPSDMKDKVRVADGGFYIGKGEPASPQIGDVRVTFAVVKPAVVSVIGEQSGDSFIPSHAEAGDDLLMLSYGKKSADQMFTAAIEANATMTWIIRFLGWLAMFIGLAMVFKPISTAGDVIPFVGSLLGLGTGIFAFIVASALSLLTVAIAWIFYRPLLGIPMVVISVGAIVGLTILGSKRKKAKAAAAGAPSA